MTKLERGSVAAGAETAPLIRPAERGDLVAVERFLAEADLPTAGVRESLDRFQVAEADGGLVGVAGLEVHGRDGVLRSVAVAPGLRGHGMGARLTERVLESARAAGLRSVYLLTTTAESYFPRHGFRRIAREEASVEVRRSVEFAEACPASAVVMVRDIGGPFTPA